MLKHIYNYASATTIAAVVSFILLPFFTRYLTPQDYGVLAIYAVFGNITASMLSLGVEAATIRFYFKYKTNPSLFGIFNFTNFIFMIAVFLIGGIAVFFIADDISSKIFSGKISSQLIILSYFGGCIANLYRYLRQLLVAQERSNTFSLITILESTLIPGIAIFLILVFSMTYDARIYGTIIVECIFLLFLLYLQRKYFIMNWSKNALKKSLHFSYPTIPNKMLHLTYQSFDRIMLMKLKNLNSLGHYQIAHRVGGLSKIYMSVIGQAWKPFFMKNAELKTDRSKNDIVEKHFEIVMVYNVFSAFACCFSEEIIKLFTTEAFYPSMYLIPLIVFATFFINTLGSISKPQLEFVEKMIYILPPSILGLIVNIIANIILIPIFGALGAVGATLIAGVCSSCLLFYFAQRVCPLPLDYNKLFLQITIFILFLIPIYILMHSDWNIIIKFILKLFTLVFYLFLLIRLNFIKKDRALTLINELKIWSLGWVK